MDWRVVIIPLIPLAVWVLATIFRSLGEQKEQERGRRAGPRSAGERPMPRPPRRATTELDRFLLEAQQRRSVPRPTRREPEAAPVREAKPPLAPPVAEPVRIAPPPAEEPRLVDRQLRTTVAMPVARPVTVSATLPLARPVVDPSAPVPRVQPTPALPAPVIQKWEGPISPLTARVGALLQDRGALQAAFVLHEVLGPPRCRRRPGEPRA